jgi:predicted DNA-binding ribbon-helix-helix protein
VDSVRGDANLSSALRVYVLEALSAECGEFDPNDRSSNTP